MAEKSIKTLKCIVLAFLSILLTHAVTVVDAQCVSGISTNPDDPKNDQVLGLYPGAVDNPFLNNWNWADTFLTGHPAPWNINLGAGFLLPWNPGGQTWQMHSPFGGQMPVGYEYLASPVGSSIKDNRWVDGWELLWMNTGYWPNGERVNDIVPGGMFENGHPAFHDKIPYVVLYNRYTGLLRVFANLYDETGDWDLLNLELKFQKPNEKADVSSVFRHVLPYDNPLTYKSTVFGNQSVSVNTQSNKQWVSADFQMGYDPCTCFYPSIMMLAFDALDSMQISIQGRAISQTLDLVNYQDSLSDFLSVRSIKNKGTGDIIYNSMDRMVNDYEIRLKKYRADKKAYDAWDENLIAQGFDALNDNLDGIADDGSVEVLNKLIKWFVPPSFDTTEVKGCNECGDRWDTIKVDKDYKVKPWFSELLEMGLKNGISSGLGSAADFLSAQILGKKPTEPKLPNRPVVSIQETQLYGSMINSTSLYVRNLYTPGSFPTSYGASPALDPIAYPVYNEVLGMYATLRDPKINFWTEIERDEWDFQTNPIFNEKFSFGKKTRQKVRMSFAENFEYALNPALDFDYEKTNVYGQIVVELVNKGAELDEQIEELSRQFENVSWLRIDDGGKLCDDSASSYLECRQTVILRTPMMRIEDLVKHTIGFDIVSTKDTKPKKIIVDGETVYSNRPDWQESDYAIQSMELKIMPDMFFNQKNSLGRQVNTTQVFTYKLFDVAGDPTNEDLGYRSAPEKYQDYVYDFDYQHAKIVGNRIIPKSSMKEAVPYFAESIQFSGLITPNHKYVHHVTGNTIYIQAMRAKVTGNLSVQSGYELVVQMVDYTDVVPNAVIGENIEFRSGFDMTPIAAIKVTEQQMVQFCTSGEYKGNQTASKWLPSQEQHIERNLVEVEQKPIDIAFKLFPNPTTDTYSIAIYSSQDVSTTIVVSDVTGRSIENIELNLREGRNFQKFSSDKYNKGVYIVSFHINGQKHTKKLLIQ